MHAFWAGSSYSGFLLTVGDSWSPAMSYRPLASHCSLLDSSLVLSSHSPCPNSTASVLFGGDTPWHSCLRAFARVLFSPTLCHHTLCYLPSSLASLGDLIFIFLSPRAFIHVCPSCSRLYFQCLAHSRCSIHVGSMGTWINSKYFDPHAPSQSRSEEGAPWRWDHELFISVPVVPLWMALNRTSERINLSFVEP